jgi:hypothetical protein
MARKAISKQTLPSGKRQIGSKIYSFKTYWG